MCTHFSTVDVKWKLMKLFPHSWNYSPIQKEWGKAHERQRIKLPIGIPMPPKTSLNPPPRPPPHGKAMTVPQVSWWPQLSCWPARWLMLTHADAVQDLRWCSWCLVDCHAGWLLYRTMTLVSSGLGDRVIMQCLLELQTMCETGIQLINWFIC